MSIDRHGCCVAGYNVCIFAYGQTGSGKTHTMAGSDVGGLRRARHSTTAPWTTCLLSMRSVRARCA